MKNKLTKTFIFIGSLTFAWSASISFRFMMMDTEYIYKINNFDRIFDWGMLSLLSIALFILCIYAYIKTKGDENEQIRKP